MHKMKNGLVVMQAEDGVFSNPNASGNATWKLKKDLAGYKGDGYMRFDSDVDYFNTKLAGSDKTGPMEYNFRIDGDKADVSGQYFITLRAMKPVTGEGSDRNNDFYVAVSDAGEDPGAWKKVFFSGSANQWLWGSTYDVNHKKSPATFSVDGPGEYTIHVSGRSRDAGLDEIHVQKGSKNVDHKAPTSDLVTSEPEPAPVKPAPKPVEPAPVEPKPAPVEPAPKPAPVEPKPAPATPEADGELTLVNARTDKAIATLGERTVIEQDSLKGLSLSVVAETDLVGVKSARMLLDDASVRVEGVAPYALFGDIDGNLKGGLVLRPGQSREVEARFHAQAKGKGEVLGEVEADISVQSGTLRGTKGETDVFVFSTQTMGRDAVLGFEAQDRIALFGHDMDAEDALALAKVSGADTVIDFGSGDVLTLKGFDDPTENHFVLA